MACLALENLTGPFGDTAPSLPPDAQIAGRGPLGAPY
jgi:hypothetical protein